MAGDDGVDELHDDVAELESGAVAACSTNSVSAPAPDAQNAAITACQSRAELIMIQFMSFQCLSHIQCVVEWCQNGHPTPLPSCH